MFTLSHLQQILKPVQNGVFQKFVDEQRADKYSKKFRCHDLLVGLVYGQLSQSTSLRVLEARFNSHPEQLYHLNTQEIFPFYPGRCDEIAQHGAVCPTGQRLDAAMPTQLAA